ncbi:LysR family transcriptional regulator [Frigidibacter sp. ROC022]|uniref:LysR family transcriptional regulator n=1 Tax=Frigidibacter sp. ROC022 TaxID=2971796 RepID=UPI00215A8EE3|nr:LysR family transcriptional regulator [Frigidibacter sp. ROC022]MCR8723590.1 LysR family transcriptional regulator [Frigidibacter sp. ROC022]
MPKENWDDLRFVLAVAETGSVSAAARKLGVNHATVLRRVASFEDRHGVEIFDKSGRGYAIPPEKLRLVEAAREVEAAHQSVERLIHGAQAPLRGVVRVTSTDSFCTLVLPGILARIESSARQLRFEILSSNAHLDLGRLHADLTVRPAEKLGEELTGTQAAVLGFGHYRARAGGIDCWLGLSGPLGRSAPAGWMATGLPPDSVQGGADSFLTLAAMVAEGLGQTILPCVIGDADPRLERVRGVVPEISVPIWVALHSELQGVPRLHAARALLAEAIAEEAPRLAGEPG